MLTCVYHQSSLVPMKGTSGVNLLRLDNRKVIVSKFTEDRCGRAKVEVQSTNKTLNQLLVSTRNSRKNKNHTKLSLHEDSDCSSSSSSSSSSTNNDESAYSSDSEPLSETCGLSISELEAMAARQARQLETQEQLLAAKAQRLRFLKSSGEAERLQRIREKVASQEERLRKLRALRGKVQSTRNGNTVLSADLESLRSAFNEKEKELSLAVAKVDELTQQLEDVRRIGTNNKDQQSSPAALELEKLRRELMYRHKLRESQSNRVVNQKQVITQRQDEAMRVDRRIAELQERLHRKRLLNSQLAASLKHQESVEEEDFEPTLPITKNDPKYQTLPYNAKLFAPFANKQDQEQFEKSLQQMHIIQDHHQLNNQQQQRQLHQQQQQQHAYNNVQSYNNQRNSQQLHHFLSQSQQQQQKPSPSLPIVRPSNFLPTGGPASSPNKESQNDKSSDVTSNGGSCVGTNGGGDLFGGRQAAKPALPPKPAAKPTPPPRQAQQDGFSYGQRMSSSSTSSEGMAIPERPPQGAKGSEKSEQNGNSSNVRVSINRRIEMPPAFLFPESDPPPSDLIPDQHNTGQNIDTQQKVNFNGNSNGGGESPMICEDVPDASPIPSKNNKQLSKFGGSIEEYTLPDLFPTPSSLHVNFFSQNNNKGEQHQNNNSNGQVPDYTFSPSEMKNDQSNGKGQVQAGDNRHVSLMNIHLGPGSPKQQQTHDDHSQKDQLSPHDVYEGSPVIEDRKVGGEEGVRTAEEIGWTPPPSGSDLSPPERDETSSSADSTTNSSSGIGTATSSSSVPGVLRRVKKSNFKCHNNREHIPLGRRVSFDPLALLLDASLEGELDLVMKTAGEVGNVSAANDEGITALHNAICAGHAEVVRFLVEFGCDVNAQDSDGWTPLHCAASCNNVGMVKFLVDHGACIFATTLSDHETAAEKCEEDEDGFGPCSEYLYSIQEKLGIMNGGVVHSVFDYDAQNPDELSFRDGERLVILRKGDEYEREWWWAAFSDDRQGYVPRNLLGLYPRVVPQKRVDSS